MASPRRCGGRLAGPLTAAGAKLAYPCGYASGQDLGRIAALGPEILIVAVGLIAGCLSPPLVLDCGMSAPWTAPC